MPSSKTLEPPPDCIVVIDSSVLIKLKSLVSVHNQWDLFAHMMELVHCGELCFPSQVAREMTDMKWPDAPGVWVGGAKAHVCHRRPQDATVGVVLADAPALIDPGDTSDAADPYVIAMALELMDKYPTTQVVVASDDRVDRIKTSMLTACGALGVEMWGPDDFIDWCDLS